MGSVRAPAASRLFGFDWEGFGECWLRVQQGLAVAVGFDPSCEKMEREKCS